MTTPIAFPTTRTPRVPVQLTINGEEVTVPSGTSLLHACRETGCDIPSLCFGETLTPKNACRVCVVEVAGSRTLVPSCSRVVEPAMVVQTDSDRVRMSRKMVLEFLGSSVDLSTTEHVDRWNSEYGADPARYGTPTSPDDNRDHRFPNEAPQPIPVAGLAATIAQAVKIDNDLYVRDYGKCILCYKCVDACGEQWQNTFAIAVAGRGFDARITTEFSVSLPDSACVYCGNCIAVCPTGALMAKPEYDHRAAGTWDESQQQQTTTVCPYCGVGCNLTLHVQNNEILKVTSPEDHSVTHGNLCIKGRFGFQHVQNLPAPDRPAPDRPPGPE